MPKSLNILVSPLDWGLGHATRLVPVLRNLEKQEHHLIIGVNDLTSDFLRAQFPDAAFYPVPSYQIKYAASDSAFALLKLIPKIIKAKSAEHKWLKGFVKEKPVDLIISDSRFGFYHSSIPSVIISHQLNLQYPKSLSLFGKYAQRINERWLKKFKQVWVPDSTDHFLSGKLSESKAFESVFIHPQSRLIPSESANPVGEDYVLVILSGPEPQRSKLEGLILNQAENIDKKLVIIGGKPHEKDKRKDLGEVIYFYHLEDKEMATYIQNASLVVSRSGYSSIMDYYTLSCRQVFFIPTPGQPEQVYLAQRMKELGICDFSSQKEFNLESIIKTSSKWKGFVFEGKETNFENLLNQVE